MERLRNMIIHRDAKGRFVMMIGCMGTLGTMGSMRRENQVYADWKRMQAFVADISEHGILTHRLDIVQDSRMADVEEMIIVSTVYRNVRPCAVGNQKVHGGNGGLV